MQTALLTGQPSLFPETFTMTGISVPPVPVPARYKIPVMKISFVREGFIPAEVPSIGGPRDVFNIASDFLLGAYREHLVAFLLDTKNKVLAVNTVSIGDLSSSIVHPRELYKPAVIAGAAALILVHNHPSGDPTPSAEDVAVTKRCLHAGEILGVNLLDHIVIGEGCFVSLKERGLI